ncbi:trypsin-like serine protease [Endozoicomonas sp. OPT23]|uniref:trypsin-like serine protease n=1 Tax=Endozoicomonas sp. OPT23 TaxID=2072845 RepID=UPI001890CB3D|nr:trypsin-like serine protease [Endozoicomonas sp. OPT23]
MKSIVVRLLFILPIFFTSPLVADELKLDDFVYDDPVFNSVGKFFGNYQSCSAVLISPRVAITAAHCLGDYMRITNDQYRGKTVDWDSIRLPDLMFRPYEVEAFTVAVRYAVFTKHSDAMRVNVVTTTPFNLQRVINDKDDFAVLLLAESVDIPPSIPVMKQPWDEVSARIRQAEEEKSLFSVGYGPIEVLHSQGNERRVVKQLSTDFDTSDQSEIIINYQNSRCSQHGDSGGGLFIRGEHQLDLLGILISGSYRAKFLKLSEFRELLEADQIKDPDNFIHLLNQEHSDQLPEKRMLYFNKQIANTDRWIIAFADSQEIADAESKKALIQSQRKMIADMLEDCNEWPESLLQAQQQADYIAEHPEKLHYLARGATWFGSWLELLLSNKGAGWFDEERYNKSQLQVESIQSDLNDMHSRMDFLCNIKSLERFEEISNSCYTETSGECAHQDLQRVVSRAPSDMWSPVTHIGVESRNIHDELDLLVKGESQFKQLCSNFYWAIWGYLLRMTYDYDKKTCVY